MNNKEHLLKLNKKNKFIICLVGEPRVFLKSLKIRNKFFLRNKFTNFESRYLINFSEENLRNKNLIFEKISYLKKDKFLKSVEIEKINLSNLFRYFLEQKYNILRKIKSDNSENVSCIILTRSDWYFSQNCNELIKIAIEKNKIVTPSISTEKRKFNDKVYTPYSSQFIVIPINLLDYVLKVLEYAIKIHDEQNLEITDKRELSKGGNGKNRFGIGDESLFGLAVSALKLNSKFKQIKFKYFFKPDLYGVIDHNLMRNDAYIWMNLSVKDIFNKFFDWYFKPLLAKRIRKLFKFFTFLKF